MPNVSTEPIGGRSAGLAPQAPLPTTPIIVITDSQGYPVSFWYRYDNKGVITWAKYFPESTVKLKNDAPSPSGFIRDEAYIQDYIAEGNYQVKGLDAKFGLTIMDFFWAIHKNTYTPEEIRAIVYAWDWFSATGRIQSSWLGTGIQQSDWGKLDKVVSQAKNDYIKNTGGLDILGNKDLVAIWKKHIDAALGKGKLDFSPDKEKYSYGVLTIAMNNAIKELYPDIDTTLLSWDAIMLDDRVGGLMDVIESWMAGTVPDTDDPVAKSLIDAVTGYNPVWGTPEQDDTVDMVGMSNKETSMDFANQILMNYQVIYGVEEGKNKFRQYWQEYLNEFEWARTEYTMADLGFGDVALPNLLTVDDVNRFDLWVSEKEKIEQEGLDEETKKANEVSNIHAIVAAWGAEYGNPGRILANNLIQDAKMKGYELYTPSDLRTFWREFSIDSVLSSWIPESVYNVYKAMGLGYEEMLGSVTSGMNRESFQNAALQNALNMGEQAIQSGSLDAQVSSAIKTDLNKIIAMLPATEGTAREFYLGETDAQELYRTYLTGNVQAGQYRNTAWEYFPQVWKNFPKAATTKGTKEFEDYIAGLGSQFFSRLSPKTEKETPSTRIRVPGGGRLPMNYS